MAGRQFTKVSPSIWRSPRFRAVSSEAKVLHLYFITSQHQNSAGSCSIPEGYACSDLGWEATVFRSALDELVAAGLIYADGETVYVDRWFVHSPPMNEKHAQGTRRLIGEIESDTIRERAEADFDDADARRNGAGRARPTSQLLGSRLMTRG